MKRRIGREIAIAALSATVGLGAFLIFEVLLHVTRSSRELSGPVHVVVHAWTRDFLGGSIPLGLLAAALWYPVRAGLALRRRDDAASTTAGELRILATLGAASSALFVATAVGGVYVGRGPEPTEPLSFAYFIAVRLERELATWSLLGAGLMLLAALWGLASVTWARREPSGSTARIVTIAGLFAVASVTSASLLTWWITVAHATYNAEWMEPERRYELTVSTGEPLVLGRSALLVVAVISAAAILIAARRPRRSTPSSRELTAAAGLFALGLVAFALTRGAAYDALHPIPLWQPSAMTTFGEVTVASLPQGKDGCDLNDREGPIASFGDGGWSVDGVRIATAADFGDVLAVKKKLWTQVAPGKTFPGLVLAVIPADTSMSLVRPYLQGAREVGYPDLVVLEGRPPRTFATRTLGEIAYRPRLCVVRASQADVLPTTGTWGDWARSLAFF